MEAPGFQLHDWSNGGWVTYTAAVDGFTPTFRPQPWAQGAASAERRPSGRGAGVNLQTLESAIDHALGPLADTANALVFVRARVGPLDLPVVVMLLALASVSITLWFGFINLRG